MLSSAYLRQQAEVLVAMSRATIDLGMAGRLRQMASDFQTRAGDEEQDRYTKSETTSLKRSA